MKSSPFLALIFSLPARHSTERMRAWRALKSMGGAVLRDGVHLLPSGAGRDQTLQTLAHAIRDAGGMAEVVGVLPESATQHQTFRTLFDRQPDYLALHDELAQLDPERQEIVSLKRALRVLKRRFHEISTMDFYPGAPRQRLEEVLTQLEARLLRRLDPNEPSPEETGTIPRRDRQAFQGRLWFTRAHPWVDRLASAWLIVRFIDPAARFLWLEPGKEAPQEAIGFDFDGALFTHHGQRVTFETLLAAFGLEDNPALRSMGQMVHALDVGGTHPEAPGLAAVLHGMHARAHHDDALFQASQIVLDDFFHYFSQQEPQNG
ncbi:MAG: chromate resistance protein [Magnetococcales bacterium]|nr:chromate resistance protein [Magnetococcales bacterium]